MFGAAKTASVILVAALDTRAAVQAIDLGVIICGGLCALGVVFWLIRRGEWRNPLAGVRAAALWRVTPAPLAGFPVQPEAGRQPEVDQSAEPGRAEIPSLPAARLTLGPQGPTLLHVAIALGAYAIVLQLAVTAFLAGQDLQAATQPGMRAWFLVQAADTLTKLLVSLLVVFMLARHPLFPRDAALPRIIRKAGIGLLTGLILAPITLVQLQMGSVIWQWLHPAQTLPVHPVLLALKESTVEAWGPAVLAISAHPGGTAGRGTPVPRIGPGRRLALLAALAFRGYLRRLVWGDSRPAAGYSAAVYHGRHLGVRAAADALTRAADHRARTFQRTNDDYGAPLSGNDRQLNRLPIPARRPVTKSLFKREPQGNTVAIPHAGSRNHAECRRPSQK